MVRRERNRGGKKRPSEIGARGRESRYAKLPCVRFRIEDKSSEKGEVLETQIGSLHSGLLVREGS